MKNIKNKSDNIPQFEMNDWLSEMTSRIIEVLNKKDRVIVNLAGASASGKGEVTEALAQKLRLKGKKVLVLSTDDFYIGAAKMVARKISGEFGEKVPQDKIEHIILESTKDKTSDEKVSETSLLELHGAIEGLNIDLDSKKLINYIKLSFNDLDFDSPSSVDLEEVANVLSLIRQGTKFKIPEYYMKFSERIGEREYDPKDYDIVLIEGIYGLNAQILAESDIKSFIETDTKTLLIRRLRRDVINSRSSYPSAVDLWIILETVLPAYWKYIAPDRKNADLILKNDYTGNETFDTDHFDVQDKIRLEEGELEAIEAKLGEPKKIAFQRDYYFASKEDKCLEHLIRLRVENGRLKDLIHKGTKVHRDDGKLVRPTEEFIKDGEFSLKYSSEEEVIESFKKGGFEIVADIMKTRRTFRLGEVKVMTDTVEGMGEYLEISTNDKLSKSLEVDKVVLELGLHGRKPIGPYADEYLARLDTNEEEEQQELLLNKGLTNKNILESKLCHEIKYNKAIEEAFSEMRRGYPDAALSMQSTGISFREAARVILDNVASLTLHNINHKKAVVLLPWRSGVAFAESFRKHGVNKFYHLSSKRDEETLSTVVDYEQGEANKDNIVIIADPMLATGNTIVDAIERMIEHGVLEDNILVCCVVAAPVGITRIKKEFPGVRIIVGALDHKLDRRGYIVPGLGDFGDKYFAKLAPSELEELILNLGLDDIGRKKLVERIGKQGESEVLSELIQRDLQDLEIDRANKEILVSEGLELKTPEKILRIDTGRVNNIKDVVGAIVSEIDDTAKILTIEGKSGTGKSSTACELKEMLGCTMLSMGEVFRYLTLHALRGESDYDAMLEKMYYEGNGRGLVLVDEGAGEDFEIGVLRSRDVEGRISSVSAENQKRVIDFMSKQLVILKQKGDHRVLIEGRAYTLDFLPSDLRVKLIADPSVRAQRRWNQEYENCS